MMVDDVNKILVDRKYAKKQLRDLVSMILEECGVVIRSKKYIKVAYPGEYLELNWIEKGFNESNDTYRVYFETSNKTYNTELCMKLKVIEHVYDKNSKIVYDVCNILKCRISEGSYVADEPFKEKRVEAKLVKMHNEVCINNLNTKRKPPKERFVLTHKYGYCREKLESIINRSLEDVSKEFGLFLSKHSDLNINELNREIHRQGRYIYHNYSTVLIKEGIQVLECNFIFKELKLSNDKNEVNCIELDSLEVEEARRLDWGARNLCSKCELEESISKSLLKYLNK